MFSSLHLFLIHIQFSPFFLTCSVPSTFFSHTFTFLSLFFHTCSFLSPFFSFTFHSLLFFSHVQFPPPFSHTHSVPSSFFSHTFSSLPLFSHTFSCLPLFSHTFSCLLFFLTHVRLSPSFFPHPTHIHLPPPCSHSCSVVSTFFSHFSVLSFFSHTFRCLLFSQTHSVAFAIQKNIVPLFLNTLSVPSPFFSVPGLPSPFKKIYTFQLPSLF